MNQSYIDHIRATTPKSIRNRRRSFANPPRRSRDLLGHYLILSTVGLGITGLITIIYVISSK
jgi:hypothetical protein